MFTFMAVHLLSEGMMLQISAKISAPVIFSKAMIRFVLMALFSVTIAGCGSGGGGGGVVATAGYQGGSAGETSL